MCVVEPLMVWKKYQLDSGENIPLTATDFRAGFVAHLCNLSDSNAPDHTSFEE